MNNEIKIFEHEQFGSVRTILIDGQPWFVGKDVADALGYSKSRNAIANHVDDEDKTTALIQGGGSNYKSNAVLINESGVYSLIFSSKLETARQFKRWVTSEVLPSIRKYGMYATEQTIDNVLNSTEEAERLFIQLKEEKLRTRKLESLNDDLMAVNVQLSERNSVLEERNTQLEFKGDFYDIVLQSEDLMSVTVIAKDYGMTAYAFNLLLAELGIQYRVSGTWALCSRFDHYGYTRTETRTGYQDGVPRTFLHMRWTQEGRKFLYRFLKEYYGIIPVYERMYHNTAV